MEERMPHFMIRARYSAAAVQAMIAKPQDRHKAAAAAVEALGGKLHGFYFAFGPDDVIAIAEAPDATAAAALSMAIGASGALAAIETVPLLTIHEAMEAMRKASTAQKAYRAPTG
jgi:uncharacterized protein with GYD domain